MCLSLKSKRQQLHLVSHALWSLPKAGALKLNNLTMEELVGIMDSMLACLVTWLEGHSAAQTILTCLYLHKPLSIEDRALRAFSIQTLKLIAIINNIVHRYWLLLIDVCVLVPWFLLLSLHI